MVLDELSWSEKEPRGTVCRCWEACVDCVLDWS